MEFSFDIETFGTAANAYIVAIGVAEFDMKTGEIGRTFDLAVECDSRFEIDAETVKWWMKQPADARRKLVNGVTVPIADALVGLSDFINYNTCVWGNGSSFDITILESAYKTCDLPVPWDYWDIRDLRTIVDMASRVAKFNKKDVKREGVHHSAVDDAIHQAKIAHHAYLALTGVDNEEW